jgi:hypothetical protein
MKNLVRTIGKFAFLTLTSCGILPSVGTAGGFEFLLEHFLSPSGQQPTGNVAQAFSGGNSQGVNMARRNEELRQEFDQHLNRVTSRDPGQFASLGRSLQRNALNVPSSSLQVNPIPFDIDGRNQLDLENQRIAALVRRSPPTLPQKVGDFSKGKFEGVHEVLGGGLRWAEVQEDLVSRGKFEELARHQETLQKTVLDENGLIKSEILNTPPRTLQLVSDPLHPKGIKIRRLMNDSLILRSWIDQHAPPSEESVRLLSQWFDDAMSLEQIADLGLDPSLHITKKVGFHSTFERTTQGLSTGIEVIKAFVQGFSHESVDIVINSGKLVAALPELLLKLPDLTEDFVEILSNLPQVLEHVQDFACLKWRKVLSADSVELGRMAGELAANFAVPTGFVKGVKYLSNISKLMRRSLVKESVGFAIEIRPGSREAWSPIITEWTKEVPELAALQSRTYGSLEAFLAADPAQLGIPPQSEVRKLLGKLTEQASDATMLDLAGNPSKLKALVDGIGRVGAEQTDRLIHVVGKPHAIEVLRSNVADLQFYSPISALPPLRLELTGDILPFKTVGETFRGGNYVSYVTTEELTLYRVVKGTTDPTMYHKGYYWSRSESLGPTQVAMDLGLERLWGNDAKILIKVELPSGFTLFDGTAAALPSGGGGNLSRFLGGGNQIYIQKKLNPEMITNIKRFGE